MTSAELLARCKLLAQRPATDELISDAQWYLLLTDGQQRVMQEIAVHVPHLMYSAPVKMTTSDNIVYTIPSSGIALGAMEVYASTTDTEPLVPGPYWDDACDYTPEGNTTIRMAGNRARSFADGPYVRYVAQPGTIDGSTQPTLKPTTAHPAIAYAALIDYATLPGVLADPEPYRQRYHEILWGDPPKLGIIPAAKMQLRQTGPQDGRWYHRFLA